MKKIALIFVSFWITSTAVAECDSYLKLPQETARKTALFQKDCSIQSRYANLQTYFTEIGINVAELAEYRILRFVDRGSFETARYAQTPPSQIYKPAPTTWEVWDTGIRAIFGNDNLAGALFKTGGFESRGLGYDHLNFSNFNAALLKNPKGDISRDKLSGKIDSDSIPGTYRKSTTVGWTSYVPDCKDKVTCAQNSMFKAQVAWEVDYGMNFNEVVRLNNGLKPEVATFVVNMTVDPKPDGKAFVAYAPGAMVPAQISWLNSFINANIARYREGNPAMPPIEFSALVQKWLVTIHPFSDGNGRTSRAAQDVILANFNMPYAPSGDLQNDTMEEFDKYVDQTYAAIELMLTKLEACAEEYRQKTEKPSYACRTVQTMEPSQLNH